MKNQHSPTTMILYALLGLLFAAPIAAGENDDRNALSDAEKALCNVCRVHDGETEAEPIAATADFEGQSFGFCSENCRDQFVETPDLYLPPIFPRPAPAFSVVDLQGEIFSSEALAGRVVLLDFWATWCPPCLEDLPKLSDLHQRYEKRGLTVVSVSIDEGDDAVKKILRAVKRRKATHPVYRDAGESLAWAAYKVRIVPAQFLIDKNGEIVAQWSGATDLKTVEEQILRILE